jgi:ribosomal-protein-alanine N-acetyltransferase
MKTEKDFLEYLNQIKRMAAEEGYDALDETFVEHQRARYFGTPVVIGQSERVLLREIVLSDLEEIYEFADAQEEPVLQAFIKESYQASEKYLKDYIENMYPLYDYGVWAVVEKDSEKLIGLCGLGQANLQGEYCTDLGYYICPKCRKQGLASESIEIVLDYVKNYLEFSVIYAIIKEENRISKGILRKFDFCHKGLCETPEGEVSVYWKTMTESKEQQ